MTSFQSWLPPAAVDRGVAAVPLAAAVAGWSGHWFAGPGATLAGSPVSGNGAGSDSGWAIEDGLAVSAGADADAALRDLLFGPGIPDADAGPTAADSAAMAAVGDACLTDLCARIAAAFGLPVGTPWRPIVGQAGSREQCWRWTIALGRSGARLSVEAQHGLIVRRVRSALPPPGERAAPAGLAAALVDHSVAVSALAGRCRLTTAELSGLGVGDVLLLDQAVAAAVPLAVDRHPSALTCTVAEDDGRLTLKISDQKSEPLS